MAEEEFTAKYKCERKSCGKTILIPIKKGIFGLRKPPYPQDWKKIRGMVFCPECSRTWTNIEKEQNQILEKKFVDFLGGD